MTPNPRQDRTDAMHDERANADMSEISGTYDSEVLE